MKMWHAPCGCFTHSERGGLLTEQCSLHSNAPDLREALLKLANEASGFLALSDIERHGMTNSRILRDRIEEARAVIVKAGGK